jgi:hypothetical protein
VSFRVKLSAIIDALEMSGDTRSAYLHRGTGEIVLLSDDDFSAAERCDDSGELSDWEREAVQQAKAVLGCSDYLRLPTSFDIHDYSIMEDFCLSVDDDDLRDELLGAIGGRGAFRCFRDTIERRGITEDWYRHRAEAYADIAVRWLEGHGIEYESGGKPRNGAPPN